VCASCGGSGAAISHPSVYPATLQLPCMADRGNREGRNAPHQGQSMNPNPRRWNGPQRARGPQNNAGNARQRYARYLARAREAGLAGDMVEMENCYQHAEHYLRVMRGARDEQTP
jgi:hypothetical protein